MKLWLDGQCFQSDSRHRGIGRYARELLKSISTHHPTIELMVSLNGGMAETAIIAKDQIKESLPAAQTFVWFGVEDGGEASVGSSRMRQLSQIALHHHIRSLAPDMALCLSPFEGDTTPLSAFSPVKPFDVPTACIFYDAIPVRLPEMYLADQNLRRAYMCRLKGLANFDKILTISEYSKFEAEALIKNHGRVINISAGLSDAFNFASKPVPSSLAEDLFNSETKTLLYVGGLDPRKNLNRLINAIGKLQPGLRSQVQLLIVGAPQVYELDILARQWRKNGLRAENFRPLGYVADRELVRLYAQADATIQPSLLEGFGLTVLEALRAGANVLCSRTGALPEVLGDFGRTFDPNDTADMANTIEAALIAPPDTNAISRASQEWASRFTWESVANTAVAALAHPGDCARGLGIQPTDARAVTATEVFKAGLHSDLASVVLSAAEKPESTRCRRLLVDITSTARSSHTSGIQRVVKKICAEFTDILRISEFDEVAFMGCDNEAGFFPVSLASTAKDWDRRRGEGVTFRPNDTILMLDSSWEFHAQHKKTLQLARLRGAQIFTAVYDLIPIRTPAFCDENMPIIFTAWLQSAISYSDGFIAISKTVMLQLKKTLESIDCERTIGLSFWHLGSDFQSSGEPRVAVAGDQPNFISVGTLEPRKAHDVTLDAFERLWQEGCNVSLTIIGRKGWGVEALSKRIRTHPNFGSRLFWIDDAEDSELLAQYQSADALVVSSYDEGFGLPVIEAQRFGKTVFLSDIPVFREIAGAGNDTKYFKVGSAEHLAQAIMENFANPSDSKQTENSHPVSRSWRESATDLMGILSAETFVDQYEHGTTVHATSNRNQTQKIQKEENSVTLEVLSGCEISMSQKSVILAVRVGNESGGSISSSKSEHNLIARVASVTLDSDGNPTHPSPNFSDFPWIIPNRDSCIVAIKVPIDAILNGAMEIIVGLYNPSKGAFGDTISVPLIDIVESDSSRFVRNTIRS